MKTELTEELVPGDEERKARKRAYSKAYRLRNLEQVKAREKAWRENNKEKCKAKRRAQYEKNRERETASNRAWQEANRAKFLTKQKEYREANRETVLARKSAWRKNNPDKANASTRRHQARKLNQAPPDASQVMIQWLYTVAKLMEASTGEPHHVDHVVPLVAGGLHRAANLQVLPASENLSKGAKTGLDPTGITVEAIDTLVRDHGVFPLRRLQIQSQAA